VKTAGSQKAVLVSHHCVHKISALLEEAAVEPEVTGRQHLNPEQIYNFVS